MTTTKDIKDTVGKALYLEFRKDNYTYQLIITPTSITLDGVSVVPATLISRKISTWTPKKNWHFSTGIFKMTFDRDPIAGFAPLSEDDAKNWIENNLSHFFTSSIEMMFHRGWTLYKRPIAVEFSYKDLEQIALHKTPADVIRRIQRSREAAGFGESLFSSAV